MRRTKLAIVQVDYGTEDIQLLAEQFIELLFESQYVLHLPMAEPDGTKRRIADSGSRRL